MARIYVPRAAEGREWVAPVSEEDYDIFATLDGSPQLGQWRPVPVRLVKADQGLRFTNSDFPWLGTHALVLRANAVRALAHLLERGGELLPLQCDEDDLRVWNVRRVAGALDPDRSAILRFGSSGRIMTIDRHAFRPEAIPPVPAFKLAEMPRGATYLSEEFVAAARAAGLVTPDFIEVWSG